MRSEPSFSIYSARGDDTGEENELQSRDREALERTVTIGDGISQAEIGEFSFVKHIDLIEENGEGDENGRGGIIKRVKGRLFLDGLDEGREDYVLKKIEELDAEGEGKEGKWSERIEDLGVEEEKEKGKVLMKGEICDFEGSIKEEENRNGLENLKIEKLGFKEEDEDPILPPSPPLYIAAGLGIEGYGAEGDLPKLDGTLEVEEYYKFMVTEYPLHPLVLKNYARILESKGELHEAEDYYYRCTLVEPEDGPILARYANLVWKLHHDKAKASRYFELAVQAASQDSDVLAAHASFLWEVDVGGNDGGYVNELEQTKAEIKVKPDVEEVDSNTLVDSEDGENMSRYATILWDVHRNYDEALFYFEKAVQACPGNSTVLAAYARFLWETEEEEEKN